MKVHLKFTEAFSARAMKSLPGAVRKLWPSRDPKAMVRNSFPGSELRVGPARRGAGVVSLKMQEAWDPTGRGQAVSLQEALWEGPGGQF